MNAGVLSTLVVVGALIAVVAVVAYAFLPVILSAIDALPAR
jgi:hypothetical protein